MLDGVFQIRYQPERSGVSFLVCPSGESLVTYAGRYETSFLIENKRDRVQCFIGLVKVFSLPEQTGIQSCCEVSPNGVDY